jgi:hypothetical protein
LFFVPSFLLFRQPRAIVAVQEKEPELKEAGPAQRAARLMRREKSGTALFASRARIVTAEQTAKVVLYDFCSFASGRLPVPTPYYPYVITQ